MLYSSSKYHLDYMLVVLCAALGAGASSRNSSQSGANKTSASLPINQWDFQYRASFIDFLLDASLVELIKSTSKIDSPQQAGSKSTRVTICNLLSNLLNGNQMKFCHQHREILEIILPQVMHLTRRECLRITADLKWNCSAIDSLLDRSKPLAFTKEAALVRSILNAAMMYLVVKTCSEDQSHRSCGCRNNPTQNSDFLSNSIDSRARRRAPDFEYAQDPPTPPPPALSIDLQDFTSADLSKLDSGSPLRITSSVIRHQGCLANTAFAEAFTRVFIDSDDIKALNRAYKILNDDHQPIKSSNMSLKRLIDSDNKDLAYIKWSKSAIKLHNNHLGRQMVRQATQRKCRCHGVSGVCPFQTCWDQLVDFETIAWRLRSVYLADSSRVEVKNIGSLERPDLCLTRRGSFERAPNRDPFLAVGETSQQYDSSPILSEDLRAILQLSSAQESQKASANIVRVNSRELIYLYKSPEYCEPIPQIKHPGTKGRYCEPVKSIIGRRRGEDGAPSSRDEDGLKNETANETIKESFQDIPGSCEHLCCNRGRSSELVLNMVTCNCRFKFCCQVECDHCLRQRVQHFCL